MVHPLSKRYNYQATNFDDIVKRANEGDVEAIAIGAAINFQGFGLTQVDTKLAREWLEVGAEKERESKSEDKLCTVMLAVLQAASIGMIGEEKKGRDTLLANRKWMTEQANNGHAQCLRILSFMHGRGGLGVERSVEKAVELLKRSADQHGDPFALYDLGIAYSGHMEQGERRKILVDYIQAARYFQRAAQMGHSDAQSELGLLITNALAGDASVTVKLATLVVTEPDEEADLNQLQNVKYGMQLLESSAAQGRISAMYLLGRAYLGVPGFKGAVARDLRAAVKWFKQADAQGFPRASIELAQIYETWFKDVAGGNAEAVDEEHNKAQAYNIYDFLLGRPRKVGLITVSTQPLTPDQLAHVLARRKALEEAPTKWERLPNGNRKLLFDDHTSLIFSPYKNEANPSRDVAIEIERAKAHETGIGGHAKNITEAFYTYHELLARKEGGDYTVPTAQEIKKIQDNIEALAKLADQVVVDDKNGNRVLVYKDTDGKAFVNIHIGPHKNWAKQQADKAAREKAAAEKAARLAAKAQQGAAPERPKDDAAKPVVEDPASKRKP